MVSETTKEKVKACTDLIEKGVSEVFTSEKYKEYLTVMSRFPKYSFNNTMLIFMQNPKASLVAGFNTWKKQKRTVKAGEKGLKIFAPVPHKKMKKTEDGEEEEEITYVTFRPVSVFDISQTEGEEIITITPMLKGDVKNFGRIWNAISNVTEANIVIDNYKDTKGCYVPKTDTIHITPKMSEQQTISTLAHEVAHSLLHKERIISKEDAEIEAESVSFIICNYLGIDTSEKTFPYIASWSASKTPEELKAIIVEIGKIAGTIVTSVEEQLDEE